MKSGSRSRINLQPGVENFRAQIVGSSFDVLYFISRATKQDVRMFRVLLLRFHVYVEDYVPFITVSYLGSPWTFDFTITTAIMSDDEANVFFQPGNAVTLFLIDAGPANTLLAGRMIGLSPEAEEMIKSACARQREVYTTPSDVQRVIDRVYAQNNPDQLIAKSRRWEFKKN